MVKRIPGRAGVLLIATLLVAAVVVAVHPNRASALTKQEAIATLAFDNVGKKACSTNSKGGKGYYKSCTGYGGGPEYWCADFAKWVWAENGVKDTSELTAAAYSFYAYAQKHGGIHKVPKLGDVAIFTANKNDLTWSDHGISHVAIVGGWSNSGKSVHTVSGDWYNDPPSGGSVNSFAGGSHVIDNGEYNSTPEVYVAHMFYYIVGYVSPVL